jgi:hypothetical protein
MYIKPMASYKLNNVPRDDSQSQARDKSSKKICCNCKKSQCLKLYCECFAKQLFCAGCNCVNCLNIEENRLERDKAMQSTLDRNPGAFDAKIVKDDANANLSVNANANSKVVF